MVGASNVVEVDMASATLVEAGMEPLEEKAELPAEKRNACQGLQYSSLVAFLAYPALAVPPPVFWPR